MKILAPLFSLLLLGAAGCATPKDEAIVPYNQEQLNALFTRARPPQVFGLTVYSSDGGPVFAGGNRVHQGDLASLTFLGQGTNPAPVVMLAGRGEMGLPALLDTCARENWATARTAEQLGLVMLSGPPPYVAQPAHVYDEVGGAAGLAQKIMLAESHVENVVFYQRTALGPLGPLARWVDQPAPVAVLGSALLRSFSYVQLDFPRRTAVFSSSRRFTPPSESTLVARLPLREILGVPAVEGALDGDPVTLLLDSAGDYELVMHEPAADTVRRLSVGDLVFPPDVNVASSLDQGLGPITYPRVGRRLLARYKVTLDYRGKAVYFERPTPAAEAP